MILHSELILTYNNFSQACLKTSMKKKAERIRNRSFQVSNYQANGSQGPRQMPQSTHFVSMFNNITHSLRNQFKQEKRKLALKSLQNNQNFMASKPLTLRTCNEKPQQHQKKTVYSEAGLEQVGHVDLQNPSGSSRRRGRSTHFSNRIIKGSTLGRDAPLARNDRVARHETEPSQPTNQPRNQQIVECLQRGKQAVEKLRLSRGESELEQQPLRQRLNTEVVPGSAAGNPRSTGSGVGQGYYSTFQRAVRRRQSVSDRKIGLLKMVSVEQGKLQLKGNYLSPWASKQERV